MNARWFRLQSVLDLRASALEEAQNSLSLALAGLGAAQNDCDQARCEAAAIADGICSAAAAQSAAQLHAARQSYFRQTRHAQALHGRVQECQAAVQKCRVQVVKASREHEILVRLREKRLKAAQYLEARKEENLLNDLMNSQRFQTLCQSPEEFLQT
jgi:flagellar export protein FliJ